MYIYLRAFNKIIIIIIILLLLLIFSRLESLRISLVVLSRSFTRHLLPTWRGCFSKAALNPKRDGARNVILPRYYTVSNREDVSHRSISHGDSGSAWVTFLNSRLKRGEIPREWWSRFKGGKRGAQRETDFIFSASDIIAQNYFLSPVDW